ncbi:MFS transporter [Larkinella insperata]|uniref:MFS transporter n=1 Tax=Larkinella insperata TaxID=332158 RepID=A0ABW3QD63_9BACT
MPTLTQSKSLRYGTFFYLYVMQGLPSGFALTTLTNYLAGRGLSAADIARFGALVGLPWGFKFIWGPLVDRYQHSAMGRRRPWVLLAQTMAFGASLGLLLITDPVQELNTLTIAFVLHGVFASLQDVSVDALAITVVPEGERGRVNALMKGGMITGQALGSAGLALVLSQAGFQTAALLQSVVLGGLLLLTLCIREEPSHAWLSLRARLIKTEKGESASLTVLLRTLARAMLARPGLQVFLAVALIFLAERLFQRVFTLDLIQRLGWTHTAVSVLGGTYGTLLAVSVALVVGWLSDRLGALPLLRMVTLVMSLCVLGYSLAGAQWMNPVVATGGLVGRQTFESVFSIAALPVLMSLCQRSVAGAQFGFYMALSNQADVVGIYGSGLLYPHVPAPVVGIGCGVVMALAGLLLVSANRPTGRIAVLTKRG